MKFRPSQLLACPCGKRMTTGLNAHETRGWRGVALIAFAAAGLCGCTTASLEDAAPMTATVEATLPEQTSAVQTPTPSDASAAALPDTGVAAAGKSVDGTAAEAPRSGAHDGPVSQPEHRTDGRCAATDRSRQAGEARRTGRRATGGEGCFGQADVERCEAEEARPRPTRRTPSRRSRGSSLSVSPPLRRFCARQESEGTVLRAKSAPADVKSGL